MAQKNIFNYNTGAIQGGPGRLILGDDPSFRPTSISDVMDMETFELKEGFHDLGATNEGIKRTRGYEKEDVAIDQSANPIDSVVSSWTNSISTTLMETGQFNRGIAFVAGDSLETAAQVGEKALLAADVKKGTKKIKVAVGKGVGFTAARFVKLGEETIAVANVAGDVITLKKPLKAAYKTTDEATPILTPAIIKTGYGAPTFIPSFPLALIVQREDRTLLMNYYYEVKISDNVEITHDKNKATLPVSFTAFAQDDLPEDENVYVEFEEAL